MPSIKAIYNKSEKVDMFEKNKKILLLAPYNQHATGCRQLASVLLEAGYLVKILIFKKFPLTTATPPTQLEMDLLQDYLEDYQPSLIGLSTTSFSNLNEPEFFSFLKRTCPKALLICGGFGPTFDARRFLEAGAHFVARGEGENCILDIAKALHSDGKISDINNICYFNKNNELISNPLYAQIDLDSIPPYLHGDEHISIIDADTIRHCDPMLIDEKMYLATTSRGCLGQCTYCAGGNWLAIYKEEYGSIKRYRTRSIRHIMDELENAKKSGATYIHFLDEYFVRSEEEFFEFFKQYKERIDLPYSLMVHSVFLEKDPKRFEIFFQSGIWYVELGVQSANEHISKEIFKRPVSTEHQLKTITKLHEYRICTAVDIITAHALEDENAYMDTLNFIKSLPYDPSWPRRTHLQVFALGLLPGAPIGDMYPILKEKPFTKEQIQYRILMAYIRQILKDDNAFFALYNDTFFKENPKELNQVCKEVFYKEQSLYWKNKLDDLADKDVLFLGVNDWFHANKYKFYRSRPKAILTDIPLDASSLDGIPVLEMHTALHEYKDNPLPIVIFGGKAPKLSQQILREYPQYKDIIVSCLVYSPQTLFLD